MSLIGLPLKYMLTSLLTWKYAHCTDVVKVYYNSILMGSGFKVEGGGQSTPLTLVTGKIEARKKGKMENKRRKIQKWKTEEGGKVKKWGKALFPFFFFFFGSSLFKPTEICFGTTKMGRIFYREKAFNPGKKSGKMTLPPLKNIPLMPCLWGKPCTKVLLPENDNAEPNHNKLLSV